VLKLLKEALASVLADIKDTISRTLRSFALLLIAAVLLLLGLLFLMFGAYESLSANFAPWQAGAMIALAVLVVALLLVILSKAAGPGSRKGSARARQSKVQAESQRSPDTDVQAAVAAEIGASIGEVLRRRRPRALEVVVAAFIAGMLFSRRDGRPRGEEGR
jgi:membrane protein implicated in regulation of membrane protease activity